MVASDILPPNTHLIGLWLQLLFGGVYIAYLPQCVSVLRPKVRNGLSIWLPIACAVMYLIVTADLVIEMVRAWKAFSVSGPTGNILADPAKYYANAATPLSLVKNSITVALVMISDGIIVYRTFVVWNFSIVVMALAVSLFCADLAMGILSTWSLSQAEAGSNFIYAEVTVRVRYFFVVTFCLNALCSALICWKIWCLRSHYISDSTIRRVFEVVMETAAIYCAHLFALIVSNSAGSRLFFVFLDFLPPVTALVFSMLVVRTRTDSQRSSATPHSTLRFSSMIQGGTIASQSMGGEDNLERGVHTDSEVSRTMYVSVRSKERFCDAEGCG
ncbi:hypothetical protein C8Q74DRAFT_561719 [Fomes fomentarius]|nr:hypothetical protein C8Q74DRAFT_561719 [Fomes fomentarius]